MSGGKTCGCSVDVIDVVPLLVVDSHPPTARSSIQPAANAILALFNAPKHILGFKLGGLEFPVFPEKVCNLLALMVLRFLRAVGASRVSCIG